MKARYEVKVIDTGKFGATLLSTDDLVAAQTKAVAEGSHYYYGTAVIDTQEHTADLGCCIVPIAEAFTRHAADCANA